MAASQFAQPIQNLTCLALFSLLLRRLARFAFRFIAVLVLVQL